MAAFAITQGLVLDEATLFLTSRLTLRFSARTGRELLEHLFVSSEARDVFTLWLEVRASNVAAIALYESLGFNGRQSAVAFYPTAEGREDAIVIWLCQLDNKDKVVTMKWDWISLMPTKRCLPLTRSAAYSGCFSTYSVTFTAEDFQDYQAVNKPLWVDYQNGAITALQLQHQRFDAWAEQRQSGLAERSFSQCDGRDLLPTAGRGFPAGFSQR